MEPNYQQRCLNYDQAVSNKICRNIVDSRINEDQLIQALGMTRQHYLNKLYGAKPWSIMDLQVLRKHGLTKD